METGLSAQPIPIGRLRPALRLAAFVGVLLLSSCATDRVIGVNERIHHDDFEYRVTRFRVADSIGSGARQRKAAGRFYIVTFEVENRALRVRHDWNNSIAYIVDDEARRYENQPELQELLNSQQPMNYSPHHSTPAGAKETTDLVFDLPARVAHPFLMVRGQLLMGDVFDGKAFTRTKVRLF
jgi:hypothetical protein